MLNGSWDLRRTDRAASSVLSAATAAQPTDAAVTTIPPLAHFASTLAPAAALADAPAASGHSSPVAVTHAVNAVAETVAGRESQSNVGLTCRASGPKVLKESRTGVHGVMRAPAGGRARGGADAPAYRREPAGLACRRRSRAQVLYRRRSASHPAEKAPAESDCDANPPGVACVARTAALVDGVQRPPAPMAHAPRLRFGRRPWPVG
eukprot:scaffold10856_cov63-Phaeocystis_antarctica.AAC.2